MYTYIHSPFGAYYIYTCGPVNRHAEAGDTKYRIVYDFVFGHKKRVGGLHPKVETYPLQCPFTGHTAILRGFYPSPGMIPYQTYFRPLTALK